MLRHLADVAGSLGLPFGERKYTYNSRLAQELGLWVETMGRGDDFHNAAFRAYFADGKNLALPEVLLAIIRTLGLPEDAAAKVLASRSHRARVDADWQLSRRLGVTAVPTFIIKNDRVTGAQPYADLRRFVIAAGAERRAQPGKAD